ncbi:MAG TPA: alpha/beta fold hydrolase [Bacteriovoracaceae bacterium]|nr:alpha/beta fold hydrolase [Bacteriovoracaceae bacterium]
MKFLTIGLFLLLQSPLAEAIILSETYLSGKEVCEKNKNPKELSFRVDVPIDYKDPQLGSTSLYAWTHKPFNPQLRTLIFVAGGPGNTSHSSLLEFSDWNVVFFDQRGNSCSRPDSESLYLDRRFYSSENTARDIEEIRKHLKVNQLSVYGVSYGTVPAHLYGHLFPESTRAIVLEGIIYRGGDSLMSPPHTRKIIQDFFDSLDFKSQSKILELSNHPHLKSNWFSNVAQKMFYLDHATDKFKAFLDILLNNDAMAMTLIPNYVDHEPVDTEYGFGDVMMGMIGCQELGMNSSTASFYSIFEKDKLVSDNDNVFQKNYCESLGFIADESMPLYQADHFPSKAPITYFQGSHDSATVLPEAKHHFQNAAKGFAQFIQINKGGHLPVFGTINSAYESQESIESRATLLKTALLGKEIKNKDLESVEEISELKWLKTIKD